MKIVKLCQMVLKMEIYIELILSRIKLFIKENEEIVLK